MFETGATDTRQVDRLRLAYLRFAAQRGQTMAEYALIVAVIALIVLAAGLLLNGSLTGVFNKTSSQL